MKTDICAYFIMAAYLVTAVIFASCLAKRAKEPPLVPAAIEKEIRIPTVANPGPVYSKPSESPALIRDGYRKEYRNPAQPRQQYPEADPDAAMRFPEDGNLPIPMIEPLPGGEQIERIAPPPVPHSR